MHKASLFEKYNKNEEPSKYDEQIDEGDVEDMKMIKDLKNRSLSIGEGE